VHAKPHKFFVMLPKLFAFSLCSTIFFLEMLGEVAQSSNVANEVPATGTESTAAEIKAASSSSSSTMANQAMARKEIPHCTSTEGTYSD
jgi:hypothetical protein